MNKDLIIMNFSHVYEEESFFESENYNWLDCSAIAGTNGYCDEDALKLLEEKVQAYGPEGVHFIDSGNYHYISHLWLNKIEKDFILVVFDHHSDMIKPIFGDILSCGSWIADELENNLFLKKVVIIGISKEQEQIIPKKYKSKIKCVCDEDLLRNDFSYDYWIGKLPIYISIDKDVLSKEIVNTSWDQGIMKLEQLERILHEILATQQVIGVDICGENKFSSIEDLKDNNKVNLELVKFLYNEEVEETV